MASHEGARKKRKMSYSDRRLSINNDFPVTASSSAMPLHQTTTSTTMNAHSTNGSCHHEQALKALNTDLDAMRQLITCKICDRFLYEPYALSCGHTYCYSCLSQWLGSNVKMTCPDCRTIIRQQPTPSYLIRELVLIFVSRNELLPDGETAEEHNKSVREEAEIVAKDKANTDRRTGGLFKGRFNRSRLSVFGPLHDPGDGVDRCPHCHWELEDGHCIHCGFEADDLDDDFSLDSESGIDDGSDPDIDHDVADMDGDGDAFLGADGADDWGINERLHMLDDYPPPRDWRYGQAHDRAGREHIIDIDAESEDEESEDDDYDHNDTFIDDEAIESEGGSDVETDATAGRTPVRAARHRHRAVVISDEEDAEDITAKCSSRYDSDE